MFSKKQMAVYAGELLVIIVGILREVDHSLLRKEIASLPRWVARFVSDDSDQRQAMSVAVVELSKRVEFRYQGSFEHGATRGIGLHRAEKVGPFEDAIVVDYEFPTLAQDTYFRNLLIEVRRYIW